MSSETHTQWNCEHETLIFSQVNIVKVSVTGATQQLPFAIPRWLVNVLIALWSSRARRGRERERVTHTLKHRHIYFHLLGVSRSLCRFVGSPHPFNDSRDGCTRVASWNFSLTDCLSLSLCSLLSSLSWWLIDSFTPNASCCYKTGSQLLIRLVFWFALGRVRGWLHREGEDKKMRERERGHLIPYSVASVLLYSLCSLFPLLSSLLSSPLLILICPDSPRVGREREKKKESTFFRSKINEIRCE